MHARPILFLVVVSSALLAVAVAALRWIPWNRAPADIASDSEQAVEPVTVKFGPQARKNVGLISKPARPQSYWRSIEVPGIITDRPGQSDRGVTAPVACVVVKIHAHPGDTVHPGDRLFTLRISSEYLQNAQLEFFKTARELQLVKESLDRLSTPALSGAIPESKVIELNHQLRRLQALEQGYRQDLSNRGLTAAQTQKAAIGNFATEIEILAPAAQSGDRQLIGNGTDAAAKDAADAQPMFEVQELGVALGQQAQAGQMLCQLANHQSLYIEGRSFKRESPALERAAQKGWAIEVEFAEDDGREWPPLEQTFRIRHLSNAIAPDTRTLEFFIPLENQSRSYGTASERFLIWRFRPGQRVRLRVPVEELVEVFVLPATALVRERGEAYVFRQNGDLFDRLSVRVMSEDRTHVVLANDGSVQPGVYLAQSAAATLNRILKSQASAGVPAGFHVHADGTVHGAH